MVSLCLLYIVDLSVTMKMPCSIIEILESYALFVDLFIFVVFIFMTVILFLLLWGVPKD